MRVAARARRCARAARARVGARALRGVAGDRAFVAVQPVRRGRPRRPLRDASEGGGTRAAAAIPRSGARSVIGRLVEPIGPAEFAARREALAGQLETRGLAGCVLFDPHHVLYY